MSAGTALYREPSYLPRFRRDEADITLWAEVLRRVDSQTTPARPGWLCCAAVAAGVPHQDGRPVYFLRSLRSGRVRSRRGRGRAPAPAYRAGDRDLPLRRRHDPPRQSRYGATHRARRGELDDRRRRYRAFRTDAARGARTRASPARNPDLGRAAQRSGAHGALVQSSAEDRIARNRTTRRLDAAAGGNRVRRACADADLLTD